MLPEAMLAQARRSMWTGGPPNSGWPALYSLRMLGVLISRLLGRKNRQVGCLGRTTREIINFSSKIC